MNSSVQFNHSVVSNSLWPHEQQYARPPFPSPTPGIHTNPCPLCQWCHPTISCSVVPFLLLPSIFSSIRVSSNESALHIRWPKYWSFNFKIRPSNEHPGLISFRMDWLDLLAVQGTLKSLLQHHSSKASIILCSAFFIVQLSHPYMTTGKTIALTRWTFVGKVMSLLFNMLSRLVTTFHEQREKVKTERSGWHEGGRGCLVFAGTAQSDSQDNWVTIIPSLWLLWDSSVLKATLSVLEQAWIDLCPSWARRFWTEWEASQNVLSCLFLNSLAFPTQMQKLYAPVESRPLKPAHPTPTPYSRRAAPHVWTCSSSPWVPETLLCPTGG